MSISTKFRQSLVVILLCMGVGFSAHGLPPKNTSQELDCRPWNNIFVPVRLPFTRIVGRPGFGFSFIRDCYSSIFASHDGYVCQFLGGNQFGVFHTLTNQLMGVVSERTPFQSFATCRELTSETGSDMVCIPDGRGVVSAGAGKIPRFIGQHSYSRSEDCYQSLRNASELHLCYLDANEEVRAGHLSLDRAIGYSFENLSDCHLATASARVNQICAPVVDGFAIFDGTKPRKLHFSTLDECLQAIME